MTTFKRTLPFDEKRKSRLLGLRDRLDLLPNGIQSQIAKSVGCTRQTVHNVLYAYDDELAARSGFAFKVWKELDTILNQPEHVEGYKTMQMIVEGLSTGSNVKIEMPLPKFRLIKRKLDKAGVPYTLQKSRGWPNSYLLLPPPQKPVQTAA